MAHEVVNTVQCRTHSPSTKTAPFPRHRCQACDVFYCDACAAMSRRDRYCPKCEPMAYPPHDVYDTRHVYPTDPSDVAAVPQKIMIDVLPLVYEELENNRILKYVQAVDILPLCS